MSRFRRLALLLGVTAILPFALGTTAASAAPGGGLFTLSAKHATFAIKGNSVVLRLFGTAAARELAGPHLLPVEGTLSPASTASSARPGSLVRVEDFNSLPGEDSFGFRLSEASASGSRLVLHGVRVGPAQRTRLRQSFNEPDRRLPGRMSNVAVTIDTDPGGPRVGPDRGGGSSTPVVVTDTSPPRRAASASGFDVAGATPGLGGELVANTIDGFQLECELTTYIPHRGTSVTIYGSTRTSRSGIPGLVGTQPGAFIALDEHGLGYNLPLFRAPPFTASLKLPHAEFVNYGFNFNNFGSSTEAVIAYCSGSVSGPELEESAFTGQSPEME